MWFSLLARLARWQVGEVGKGSEVRSLARERGSLVGNKVTPSNESSVTCSLSIHEIEVAVEYSPGCADRIAELDQQLWFTYVETSTFYIGRLVYRFEQLVLFKEDSYLPILYRKRELLLITELL